jgi:hypothetical protein
MKVPSVGRGGPVIAVWLLLMVVTNLPYLRAWVWPPRGAAFLGVFYSIPDVYNYYSYVQQAEEGALLFINKLAPEPHAPALMNLEWWLVGWISALLGGTPGLAYRIFGALVTLALIAGVDRWLRVSGLPSTHRLAALLLVFTGAGFGGVLFKAVGPPAWRFLDLTTGLFPIVSILVNPHFVAGTCLLVWALYALGEVPGRRGAVIGILLGTALGLVRPYDLVLLVAIRIVIVVVQQAPATWPRSLLPLAGLLPVVAYDYWVFYRYPPFRALSSYGYAFPQVGSLLLALLPVLAVPLLLRSGWWRLAGARLGPGHVFTAWALVGAAFMLQPFSFSLQFLANWGLPLLALGALGLAVRRPAATFLVAAALSTTGLVAVRLLLEDNYWYIPTWKMSSARLLRAHCRPGDVALAPTDLGLLINAHSSCSAHVAHPVMRDYARREQEVDRFFNEGGPQWRAALLERACVRFVLFPLAPHGLTPRDWMGEATPFASIDRRELEAGAVEVWERAGPRGCPLPGAVPPEGGL